ncbi:hypothetical protein WR25_01649 isoform B [Diploscapter pachys]|uniref:Thyroglobulin type-1 domain-containing protein n=1 Tax=Diploscapter pachys TaxID=2018661 RepID=A0A2A2JSB0_9BILA|nr:hypothetical protein WR25_01649 isoform B [Diploscapter pachys]
MGSFRIAMKMERSELSYRIFLLYIHIDRCRCYLVYCILSSKTVHLLIMTIHYQTSSYTIYNFQFVPIQCDMKSCWCVDVHYGNEIAGSRISKAMRRADMCRGKNGNLHYSRRCQNFDVTEFRLCFHRCTNNCAHGLVMDEYGCPAAQCKCREICDKVKCTNPSDTCQLVEPDCAQPPCLPIPRCILNPCGSSPPMTLPTGVTALCTTNEQCSDDYWCHQIGYNGLGFCCPGPTPFVKKERCPAKSVKKETVCGESNCDHDEHCTSGKCCFDGCALSCISNERISNSVSSSFQTKIAPPKKSVFHPGDTAKHNKAVLSSLVADCPDTIISAVDIPETGNCTSLCKGDFDCAGLRRCCRIGCSTSCMYPIRSTPCFHLALTAELYSLRNAKRCDVTGNFEQKQCDDNGCYCVDIMTGDEQPGTRRDSGKPNCNVATPCTDLHCQATCPYGYELNPDGCPSCRCKNPCADIKCPQGSMCIMSPVACYSHDNCPPLPRCLLNLCPADEPYISSIGVIETCADNSECPKEHFCHKVGIASGGICCIAPLPTINSGVCPIMTPQLDRPFCRLECKSDGDCTGNRKCCYDGCGTICRIPLPAPISPEMIKLITGSNEDFNKPGDCPHVETHEDSCEEGSHECTMDSDCSGVMRCCSNGCVRVCAFPDNLTACLQFKAALQQLGQMDRIKCRPANFSYGSYEEIQCDEQYCWCVDTEGRELQGTRTAEDVSPDCIAPRNCPTLNCPVKRDCRFGVKKDDYCCPGSSPSVHPGSCPHTVSLSSADCGRECVTDSQCSPQQKCCFTGCGLSCSMAEFSNELPASIHIGACLPVKDIGAFCVQRTTVKDCDEDADCPNLFKCCSDGCVNRCTPPHAATQCIHARIAALALLESNPAIFVPDCDSEGEFALIQSHYGLSWCVDEKGNEIPGTKSTKVPNCKQPRICPVRPCAKSCPFGFTTDNDGCEVCDCIQPCALVLCPAGTVCRMIEPICFSEDCEAVPKCIPNTCPSGKPLAVENDILVVCDEGVACPAGYFCQKSGYLSLGFCCFGSSALPKTFTCPSIPVLTSSVDGSPCVVSCRYAGDCPRSSCCFNGCGTSCQFEMAPPSTSISKKMSKHPALPSVGATSIQISSHTKVQPISPVSSHKITGDVKSIVMPISNIPSGVTVSGQKIGTCPMFITENTGCKEECTADLHCTGHLKCCKASCGTICIAPRIATACIHLLLAYEKQLKMVGSNLPPPVQCNSDGTFRTHQCDIITKQCWCVEGMSGVELPGSRIESSSLPPDCDSVRDDLCGTSRRVMDELRNTKSCFSNADCRENSRCMSESQTSDIGVCCANFPVPRTKIIAPVATRVFAIPTSTQRPTRIRPVSSFKKIDSNLPGTDSKKPFVAVPLVKPIINLPDLIRTKEKLKTNCTSQREAIESFFKVGISVKAIKPLCDESTGNFLSVQCDPFGTCWCVNPISGIEVHGTRTRQAIGQDVCRTPRICANHCLSAICPYGLLTDNFGCPQSQCLCRSPCEEIECKTGDICILRRADCGDSAWCLPIPTCEPTPCNIGLRPLVEPKTRQQFSCMNQGPICPTGFYCTGFDKNALGVCCPGKESLFSSNFDHEQTCKHGDPFSSSTDGVPFTCTVTANGCPPTHYCATKPNQRKGVCCVSKRYVCNLPLDRGPCSVSVPRYHYNSVNRSCMLFEYGGCSGNLNNFATLDDCEQFCSGVGLDLSSPYLDLVNDEPIESYQLGFSLSGPQITAAQKQVAEKEIETYLSERFFIPHGSVEALSVRDDNTVRFTIRDVLSREFARNISDAVCFFSFLDVIIITISNQTKFSCINHTNSCNFPTITFLHFAFDGVTFSL